MTLSSLEAQLKAFDASIQRIEEAGLIRSPFLHECRALVVAVLSYDAQVNRAVASLQEGRIEEAVDLLNARGVLPE